MNRHLPIAALLVPQLPREVWCWAIVTSPWPRCLPEVVVVAPARRKMSAWLIRRIHISPVACDYCRRNPARWTRHLTPAEAADLRERGEASRLDIDRRFGWDAVPSNTFTTHDDVHGVLLEGTGEGHGIGLCQKGAKSMAQSGATFREILDHYYPNTVLVRADRTPVSTPASIRAKASIP